MSGLVIGHRHVIQMMKVMMTKVMMMTSVLIGLLFNQGQRLIRRAARAILVESQHSSPSLITESARPLCGASVAKATPLSPKMFGSSPNALMTE